MHVIPMNTLMTQIVNVLLVTLLVRNAKAQQILIVLVANPIYISRQDSALKVVLNTLMLLGLLVCHVLQIVKNV